MSPVEINEVLNGVELTHPIEIVDVAAIRDALGGNVEVFHRIREVVVRLRVDGKQVYERFLPVKGAPPLKKM